jgi:Tfp pilus assembly protein PilO
MNNNPPTLPTASPDGTNLSHAQYRQFYAKLLKARRSPLLIVSFEFVLTILLTVFLIWFAIRPTVLTITELVREIEDVRDVNQQLVTKVAALTQAEVNLAQAKPELELLDQAIPSSPLLTETFSLLQVLIQKHQVNLTSISGPIIAFPIPAKPEIKTYEYTISIFGDYANLKALSQNLESQLRLNAISNLAFTQEEDNEEAPGLNAKIQVIFYSYERTD